MPLSGGRWVTNDDVYERAKHFYPRCGDGLYVDADVKRKQGGADKDPRHEPLRARAEPCDLDFSFWSRSIAGQYMCATIGQDLPGCTSLHELPQEQRVGNPPGSFCWRDWIRLIQIMCRTEDPLNGFRAVTFGRVERPIWG